MFETTNQLRTSSGFPLPNPPCKSIILGEESDTCLEKKMQTWFQPRLINGFLIKAVSVKMPSHTHIYRNMT